jgi:hypothetical protein
VSGFLPFWVLALDLEPDLVEKRDEPRLPEDSPFDPLAESADVEVALGTPDDGDGAIRVPCAAPPERDDTEVGHS